MNQDIDVLNRRIHGIQSSLHYLHSRFLQSLEVQLSHQYHFKLSQLDTFWAQRSSFQWLQLGDRNTKFFQTAAKLHARNNHITHLVESDGSFVSSLSDMHNLAESYFTSLFRDLGSSFPIFSAHLFTMISSNDNLFLNSMPEENEVGSAVFAISLTKAPG